METTAADGRITSDVTVAKTCLNEPFKAEGEYRLSRQGRDDESVSDFDQEVKRLEGKRKQTPS